MKKAVIYARYSSDKQTEQSIEGQIRVCRQFAENNGYTIIDSYIDRAMTGTNDHRPAFQQMIKDSERQSFEFVLVYKLDRFSRNRYDSAINKHKLHKNGVRVLSAMENIADTPEGIILESVIEGMNEYYSLELSQKVRRGHFESIQKGYYVGGIVPFGYFVKDKKLEIHQENSKIVKFMFEEYNKGTPASKILEKLKEMGAKNAAGNHFRLNNVIHILNNVVYIGTLKYGQHIIDNYYPAIISREIFDMTKQKLKLNKAHRGKGKATTNYLLSGKLYCGLCQKLMCGESGNSRSGSTYYYYKCSTRKNHNACEQIVVKKQEFETYILNIALRYIYDDEFYKKIINELIKLQEDSLKNNFSLKLLESELSKSRRQLENVMNALKEGIYTKSTKDEILKLEEDIQMFQDKIEIAKHQLPVKFTENMLLFWFEQFKDFDTTDEKVSASFINAFIHKVILFPDKLVIIFNHSEDNSHEFSVQDYISYSKDNKKTNTEEQCSSCVSTGGIYRVTLEHKLPFANVYITNYHSILEINFINTPNWVSKKQNKI